MLHILTLNWNGKTKLEELSNSIDQINMPEYIWHIKDNGSTDDSLDFIKTIKNVNLIETGHNNDNFAAGCNILYNQASPDDKDLILLLNNDIVFKGKDDLINMINLLNKDVGVVGAKLLYKNTNKIQHNGVIFDRRYSLPTHFAVNKEDSEIMSRSREFQAVTGAVMLTKSEYFKQIKNQNKSKRLGLDEDFIWCYEDVAACLSIRNDLNKRIICYSKSTIFHEESATLKINKFSKLFLAKNIQTFHLKYRMKYKIDREFYETNYNYNTIKE